MINGEIKKLIILWIKLLFLLVLGGCINNNSNTNRFKKHISNTNRINNKVYKVILLSDTICKNNGDEKIYCKILVECKDKWSKYFSNKEFKSQFCSKTIISYILDTSNNAIFINGFEKTLLKINLKNGNLLVRKDISQYDLYAGSKTHPPKFNLIGEKVIFSCDNELLIFNKDLEIEYAHSDSIKKRLSQYEHSMEYTYIEYPKVKISNDSHSIIIRATFKYVLGLGTKVSPFKIKTYIYKDSLILNHPR